MTEESDDEEEPNRIVLHKLEWRSESKVPYVKKSTYVFSFCCSGSALNKYIKILDIRLSKLTETQELAGNVAKKVRVLGAMSQSNPPYDAPTWAVRKESVANVGPEQGMYIYIMYNSGYLHP